MKFALCAMLLIVLSLIPQVLPAVMELVPNPDSLDWSVYTGCMDTSDLVISNPGTTDRYYSLFTLPSELQGSQIAYYPFSGGYEDYYTGTTGTMSNLSLTPDRHAFSDNALNLNGSALYTTRDFALQNQFSVAFWANPASDQPMTSEGYYGTARAADYLMCPAWGGTNNWAGFGIGLGTNGIMLIEHAHAYMPVLLSYSANLSGWHHYTINFTNHAPSLYIDGVFVRSGITSQRTNTRLSHDFGNYVYGSYQGYLDELCVFNAVLNQAQISSLAAFNEHDRYYIHHGFGSIPAGTSQTVSIRMVDNTLPLGVYNDHLSLCECSSALELANIPITLRITDLAPLAPANLSISSVGTHEVMLQWSAVTQDTFGNPFTPVRYHIFRSDQPGPIWNYSEVGQTTQTVFHDLYDPMYDPPRIYFYYVSSE